MLGFCPKSIIVFGIAFAGVPYIYSCRDTDAQNLSEDIRVVYRPAVKLPDAINVDIFWCSDDDSARTRQIAAAELAGSYATIAKVSLPISKTGSVGEIRTRPIRRDIYYNKVGKVSTDLGGQDATAVFDDHDDKLNSVSGIFATQGLRSLKIAKVPDDIYAPNYISVYVCSDVDTSGLLGRLYFQVKDVSQKETAADAAATIRKSLPGVSIANSNLLAPRCFRDRLADLKGRFAQALSKRGLANSGVVSASALQYRDLTDLYLTFFHNVV
jgi:hypothetical protein